MMTSDLTGRTIRGYQLLEAVGQGGFGAVYRAHQPAIAREVAVKVILPEYANQPEFIRRFETEAQLVARLEHPFVVPLFDYWRDPDGAYLVMRLYRGGSLRALLDRERLSPDRSIAVLEQVAGALAVAHRNNVIHRDLKPDNILMDEEGNAYLADFGIAKVRRAGGDDEAEEGIAGSPGYMSPEQITLEPVTPQTDIYSLGIILYELFAGQHPFPDFSTTDLIFKQLQDPLPDLTLYDAELPGELNMVIQRATAKQPEDRYPDVMALVADAKHALSAGGGYALAAPDLLSAEELAQITNPYKGLRPFEESDAADFFGREALVAQLVSRLRPPDLASARPGDDDYRFLAVVGPSGSGKSSVVKAGLLPALRWGEIPGSQDWFIVEMVPGADPLGALADALTRVAIHAPANMAALLGEGERALLNVVRGTLPAGSELLLVIDQFEEVFTLVDDEKARAHFLNLIRAAATEHGGTVRVIITLRADFYDRPLLYEGFGALMRLRTEVVLPLAADELERAITGPATRVGLEVEPNLLAAIVADVREEPGALPLLQYVLTEVFERREGRSLTLYGYQASGGALGALARRADELYRAMNESEQRIARQLFLRLVTLGEGAEDTRRRASWAELMSAVGGGMGTASAAVLQALLDRFGKYRLLSFDRDPQTREPTVEVAHEALIREWGQLRRWLADGREDIRQQRALAAAAGDWHEAGREASFLVTGARLVTLEDWAGRSDLALTQLEREYLEASIARRAAEQAEAARRQAEEAAAQARMTELERQSAARARVLNFVLAAGFVVALILSGFALVQGRAAQAERDNAQVQQVIAEREAAVARSLALSAGAAQLDGAGDREIALALALAANAMTDPPETAQRTLAQVAYAPGIVRRFAEVNPTDSAITGHTAPINDSAYRADGGQLLTGGDDGRVVLWDAATGAPLRAFDGHGGLPVTSVAFVDGAGTRALSGSWDLSLVLWDVATGEALRRLTGHRGVVSVVAVTPDGARAVSGSTDGLIVWDLATGEIVRRLETDEGATSLAISPDGATALSGSQTGTLTWWDLTSGEALRSARLHTSAVLSVAISPDGATALSTSRDGSILYWDAVGGALLGPLSGDGALSHTLAVNQIAYSADGRVALTASDDGGLLLWEVAARRPIRRFAAAVAGAINTVSFAPGPAYEAVAAGDDRAVILWDARGGAEAGTVGIVAGGATDLAVSAAGDLIFAAGEGGDLLAWTRADGGEARRYSAPEASADARITSAAFSPDGRYVAAAFDNLTLAVWDANTGDLVSQPGLTSSLMHSDIINDLAFHPDGSRLASAGSDDLVIVWESATGAPAGTLSGLSRRVFSVAYTPDGARIIGGGGDRLVIVWDAASGDILHTLSGHAGRVRALAVSPDGATVYSGSDAGDLIAWDITSGAARTRFDAGLDGGAAAILSLAVRHDGTTLLAGGDDGGLTLWNTANGAPTRQLLTYQPDWGEARSQVTALSYSPDGATALAGLRDGRIIRVETPALDGLIAWATANRFVPELTCAQRAQYGVAPLCDANPD